jgi:hypothetical protein
MSNEATSSYSGLLTAFPYAFRESESRLFRSYVLLGGLLSGAITLLFGFGLVVLMGNTARAAGGSFTFSRAFFIFVGFLVVTPVVAPVLLVARRTRRGANDPGYDAVLGATGYLFILSLYLGLVITIPECFELSGRGEVCRSPPQGLFAPVVGLLYFLPQKAGLLPPMLGSVVIYLGHRLANRL